MRGRLKGGGSARLTLIARWPPMGFSLGALAKLFVKLAWAQ